MAKFTILSTHEVGAMVKSNKLESKIGSNIQKALKEHDEVSLEVEIIKLMDAFLEDKVRASILEMMASQYVTAEYYWPECKNFKIKDKVLENVYEALSSINHLAPDKKPKDIVRKLLNTLKDRHKRNKE